MQSSQRETQREKDTLFVDNNIIDVMMYYIQYSLCKIYTQWWLLACVSWWIHGVFLGVCISHGFMGFFWVCASVMGSWGFFLRVHMSVMVLWSFSGYVCVSDGFMNFFWLVGQWWFYGFFPGCVCQWWLHGVFSGWLQGFFWFPMQGFLRFR